jgi:hypothetical protein
MPFSAASSRRRESGAALPTTHALLPFQIDFAIDALAAMPIWIAIFILAGACRCRLP